MRGLAIIIIICFIASCNLVPPRGGYVNESVSKHYRYGIGKRSVYYCRMGRFLPLTESQELIGVDTKTFRPLTESIGKDTFFVYSKEIKLEAIDAASFYIKSGGEFCDKEHVYNDVGKAITDADPVTFTYIKDYNSNWAKDKKYYFIYIHENYQIVNVDFDSFKFLNYYFTTDKNKLYYRLKDSLIGIPANPKGYTVLNKTYICDNKSIYFQRFYEDIITIPVKDTSSIRTFSNENWVMADKKIFIEGKLYLNAEVDTASFTIFTVNKYCKDKNHVYYNGQPLANADAATFDHKGYGIFADKNHVYLNGEIRQDVDTASIKYMGCNLYKDNHHIYKNWRVIPEANPVQLHAVQYSREMYFLDNNHVFYNTCDTFHIIEKADPKTFIYDQRKQLWKDANATYMNEKRSIN